MKCSLYFLLSFFVLLGYAQTEAPAITAKDVDRFIDTYEPLVKEFEDLGDEYEGIEDPSSMQLLMANDKVMSILEKYGWDEDFSTKWVYVAAAYSMVKMDQQIAELPADQQEQFRSMMGSQVSPYAVSDEVKNLIEARIDEMDRLFDN